MSCSFGLENHGEALAHFVLPLKGASANVKAIEIALADTRREWLEKEKRDPVICHQFLWIAGQCDLLLRITLDDFRLIAELQSRLLGATIRSVSWIFCVPFSHPESMATTEAPAARPFSFALHLRVRRSIYNAFTDQGEKTIVEAIQGILADEASLVSGSASYSLGWADLTIQGTLAGNLDHFLAFLFRVHGLHIHVEGHPQENVYVFSKSLTVMGLDWQSIRRPEDGDDRDGDDRNSDDHQDNSDDHDGSDERAADLPDTDLPDTVVRPAVLVRVFPGNFSDTYEKLKQLYPAENNDEIAADVHVLDGKWDLRVTPKAGEGSAEARDFYSRFEDLKTQLINAGVERTQTHFFFFEAQDAEKILSGFAPQALDLGEAEDFKSPCSCAGTPLPAVGLLKTKPNYLPASIRTTASNVLLMFSYALRDRANCCDSRPALEACGRGLEDLLLRLQRVHELMLEPAGEQAQWYEILESLRGEVESWCTHAEHVLRERTSGSFDDLFSPSDSLASYRGSLQKVLFIADNLAQEFYWCLDPPLRARDDRVHRFSTIYRPQSVMSSAPLIGVINVPVRHAFSLHLILPQLWHEVGQYVFHRMFTLPLSTKTEKRLATLLERLEEAKEKGKINKFIWMEDGTLARDALIQDTSDMFSDLLVLHYGFRGNSRAFIHHLATLHFDSIKHNRLPRSEETKSFIVLFIRVFFALLFLRLRDFIAKQNVDVRGDEKTLRSLIKSKTSETSWLTADNLEFINEEIGNINDILAWLLSRPKYRELRLPPGILETAYRNIASEIFIHFWAEYMEDLLVTIGSSATLASDDDIVGSEDWGRLQSGEVVAIPKARVNDFYLALYNLGIQRMLDATPGAAPDFRIMGALGRSAILAFYGHER